MAGDITSLLERWSGGEQEAMRELMPLVYPRLRAIAGGVFRGSREDSSVQPTVIVHEMYLRLVNQKSLTFSDREHFYSFRRAMYALCAGGSFPFKKQHQARRLGGASSFAR